MAGNVGLPVTWLPVLRSVGANAIELNEESSNSAWVNGAGESYLNVRLVGAQASQFVHNPYRDSDEFASFVSRDR